MLTKDDYLLGNFSKIKHKKWELFVITRIIHTLDDTNLEYVCQQYINVKGNRHYLADICFPSLKIYYEIDEGQHATEKHKEGDKKRTRDILDATKKHEDENKIKQREVLEATDWILKRIRVYDKSNSYAGRDLQEVIEEVDQFVIFLKDRKKKFEEKLNKKIIWDYKNKFNPSRYINNGSISVDENVVFRYIKDCLKLFGYTSDKHLQGGWWTVGTKHLNQAVWLPKLYPNKQWSNTLSQDRETITENEIVDGKFKKMNLIKGPVLDRIVFAHYKNIFGQTVYKFYGVYRTDIGASNKSGQHIHRRISKKINLSSYI